MATPKVAENFDTLNVTDIADTARGIQLVCCTMLCLGTSQRQECGLEDDCGHVPTAMGGPPPCHEGKLEATSRDS